MPRKLLIIAALALALSACGGGSGSADDKSPAPDESADVDTADGTSTDDPSTDDGDSGDDTDDGRKPIGEPFVTTKEGADSLEITLTAYEPGSAAEEHVGLVPEGEDLYIAYFTVKNVGVVDQDAIIYDNYLVDADNKMVHEKIINLDGCQSFNEWSPTLAPGESVEGCVGFTIEPDFEPIELMATGFGDYVIPIWTL